MLPLAACNEIFKLATGRPSTCILSNYVGYNLTYMVSEALSYSRTKGELCLPCVVQVELDLFSC